MDIEQSFSWVSMLVLGSLNGLNLLSRVGHFESVRHVPGDLNPMN